MWKECKRVLADGYRMCINIGDQFARSVYYGRYKAIPISTEIIRFSKHWERTIWAQSFGKKLLL